MSNARYLAKLKAYYAFWATYVRDAKSPIKQMRVLTITRSEERKHNLRKIADQISPEAKGLFWFICEKAYVGNPQQVLRTHGRPLRMTPVNISTHDKAVSRQFGLASARHPTSTTQLH